MRRILFILFAIIFFLVGSDFEVRAQSETMRTAAAAGPQNISERSEQGKLLPESGNGADSEAKQNSFKPRTKARFFMEESRDRGYSFELKLFLAVTAIMLLMAIFNTFEAKEEMRECCQFD